MAVIAKWLCDRDESMFDSKKEAELHDKMLELGEQLTLLLLNQIPDVDAQQASEFGIYLSKNKELLLEALKGKPETLSQLHNNASANVEIMMAESA